MSKPWEQRFAALDIECTNLRGTYGRILCVCMKFFDEKTPRTFTALNASDEPTMLTNLSHAYWELENSGGVLVTYNGKMFDFPYINGRLIQHDLTTWRPIKHVDLLYHARKFRFASARLACVEELLELPSSKFNVHPEHWIKAANGDADSLAKIVKHCKEDVKMTQELYGRLAPVIACISK